MTDVHTGGRSALTGSDGSGAELSALLTALREAEQRDDGDAVARTAAERTRLLRAVAETIVAEPAAAAEAEPFAAFLGALTQDLDTETRQVVSRALFTAADSRGDVIAEEIAAVRPLVDTDDPVAAAWIAGALGRVAEAHPDVVAPVVGDLAALVERENQTVRHNAVEALATVARERPDAVAPVADALRPLLNANDVAVQHNTAGVFGVLAATHPDAVAPAAERLASLRSHSERAVRTVATGALVRLAQRRPDVVESVPD